jgi:hypothetical protein
LTGWFAGLASAATFKMSDGATLTGELVESGSNDATALISIGGGEYKRVPWAQFSQEDLKGFLGKYAGNKKITEAVEPFIEVSQEERKAKTEVTIKPINPTVERLQKEHQEPRKGLFASVFQTGLGFFLVLLVYGANIYAGYEIAIFRAQHTGLVAALAAIPGLGFLSNIVFLALPTKVQQKTTAELALEEAAAANPNPPTIALPGQEEAVAQAAEAAAAAVAAGPQPEVYSRGKTTFNKRFFETKFPTFFGMTRREEDRAKMLFFKTQKGDYIAQRITRVTPAEIHIQTDHGGATIEVSFAFPEILEVILKHHA